MPKYTVYYVATVSSSVEIEAADESEARELADKQFEQPHLCHQCAREMDMSDWEQQEAEWGICEVDS